MYRGDQNLPHYLTISHLCKKCKSYAIIFDMNILYCGDQGISRGILVSILSILKHNVGVLHFYIMTIDYPGVKPFEAKTARFLDELVKKTNAKSFVKLINATKAFRANLPKKNMGTYFTPCAMLRLYMDKVPEFAKINKMLYLDYDVVCRGDLVKFYDMDMKGVEVAGVLDIYGRRWYKYHGVLKRKNDVKEWVDIKDRPWSFLKQDYMNSGVMLFNLEECRKTRMLERARELCANKRMLLPDQGALNRAIMRRRLVARKFNEQEERPRPDTVLHHFSNNFKFWPYFRVQKVKPFEVEKIHNILKIHEYDDILKIYKKLEVKL